MFNKWSHNTWSPTNRIVTSMILGQDVSIRKTACSFVLRLFCARNGSRITTYASPFWALTETRLSLAPQFEAYCGLLGEVGLVPHKMVSLTNRSR